MNDTAVEIPFSGKSMDPLFKDINSVWVDFSKTESVRVGDILLYRDHQKEWVCHRLIFIDDKGYWLKGDANTTADCVKDILPWGQVCAIQRQGRRTFVKNSFATKGLCYVQKKQVVSQIWLVKKFYRFLAKVFLSLEIFFSN